MKRAKGRSAIIRYQRGGRLTLQESIVAKCYACRDGYADGIEDCGNWDCPLYPWMPYGQERRKKNHPGNEDALRGFRTKSEG